MTAMAMKMKITAVIKMNLKTTTTRLKAKMKIMMEVTNHLMALAGTINTPPIRLLALKIHPLIMFKRMVIIIKRGKIR